jgi:hypothetical protein
LLAFLVAALHPLDPGVAGLIWALLSLAALVAALWLLDLRDWRCYALSSIFLVTRSAVDLGTVGPLLLLATAAAWRWRERVIEPAVAVGIAVALKLFLWPLAAWLALMRRGRAALAGVGCAVAFALLPWAGIGFVGIDHYPGLLRHVSNDEASSSYSVIALAVRTHLPQSAGVALSVLAALVLLAAAAWIANDERRTVHDRDVAVLTLALAAALAASPIVWVHYFLLLLVPLALTQRRLSALWFVPLGYSFLSEAGWPAGDATKLAVGLVTTLVLIGGPLLVTLRRPARSAPSMTLVAPGHGFRREVAAQKPQVR